MEEATITSINNTDMVVKEPLIKERFPTVVDTDDLILELGKKEVDRLNKEKLLEGLLKQKQAMQETISLVQVELPRLQSELKVLKESNAKYEANNRTIADSLTDVRNKYAKEQEEHTHLRTHSNKYQEDLKLVYSSLTAIQDKYNKEAAENEKNRALICKLQEEVSILHTELVTIKSTCSTLNKEKLQLEELPAAKPAKKIKKIKE